MKKGLLLASAFVVCGICSAQTPAGSPPQSTAQVSVQDRLPAGTIIPAELSKSVDAKKTKPGDKIEAKTSVDLLSHGKVVIPRDTKIIGHVTDAKGRTKESPDSMVGIAFDRMSMKGGQELTMQAAVQAIGRPLQSAAFPENAPMNNNGGGMPPAGAPPQAGGQTGGSMQGSGSPSAAANTSQFPAGSAAGNSSDVTNAGNTPVAPLGPTSQGVVGMNGLSLNASGQMSVVSSNSENVHLDSGTQLILRVQ